MLNRMFKRVLLLLLAGGCAPAFTAEQPPPSPQPTPSQQSQQYIYKWTDAQGMAKYSELPPPQGVKFEMVAKSAAGIATGVSAPRDLAKAQEELAREVAEQEAKERAQMDEAKKQQEETRAKNCEIAKKNVQVLEGGTQVVRTDDKGNKVVLDDEQRATELQRAKKDADYFCNP